MPNFIALIASDLHVRNYDRIWARHPSLVGDTTFALQQIAEIFQKYCSPSMQGLLLAGDNFEAKLHRSDAIAAMGSFLDAVLSTQRQVYYVQGDHEYSDPPFMQAIRGRTTHVHKRLVQLGPVSLYGLDYVPLGEAKQHLATMPQCDLFLTHQKWSDLLPHGDCAFSDVPAGLCRLLVTGDYHISLHKEFGGLRVLSPGSVCMQDLGESPQKFVWLLDDQLAVHQVPLVTRPYLSVHLTSEIDFEPAREAAQQLVDESRQTLPAAVAMPILRVFYPSDKYELRRWMDSAFGMTCHLFYSPQVGAGDPQQTQEAKQRRQVVMDTGLPGVIRTFYNQDPVIAEAAVRMVQAADKEEEARRLFVQFKAQGEVAE